jgi:membrane protein YqaA with SNARE-associated domain
MDNTENAEKSPRRKLKRIYDWLKKRAVPLAGLLFAVGIIAAVSIIYVNNKDIFEDLENYGYLGAFVISVVLNATLIVPVSNMAVIFTLGAAPGLNPIFVGLAGGIGAGIGEMTGYLAGRSGRSLLTKGNMYNRVERWVKRWGWIAVFVFSIFPFVFDVVGIIAGAMRMPFWKFFLACWLGRTISYITVAYLAHLGFQLWFMN